MGRGITPKCFKEEENVQYFLFIKLLKIISFSVIFKGVLNP